MYLFMHPSNHLGLALLLNYSHFSYWGKEYYIKFFIGEYKVQAECIINIIRASLI